MPHLGYLSKEIRYFFLNASISNVSINVCIIHSSLKTAVTIFTLLSTYLIKRDIRWPFARIQKRNMLPALQHFRCLTFH